MCIRDSIYTEWKIIKGIIHKTTNMVLGERKKNFRRGLNVWNEHIDKALKEKQKAYNNMLSHRTPENLQLYREKRNIAKTITRKAHTDSWEQYIYNIEDDVHGRQEKAYKIMKHLNKKETDGSRLNIIEKEEWLEDYKKLFFYSNIEEEEEN